MNISCESSLSSVSKAAQLQPTVLEKGADWTQVSGDSGHLIKIPSFYRETSVQV